MSKIEKIVTLVLLTLIITSIAISYFRRASQKNIEIVPISEVEDDEKSAGIIEKRKIININTADLKTLTRLPAIGPHTANLIIDYRTKNKRFNSPEDLLKVKGIGPKKYEHLKNHITVDE